MRVALKTAIFASGRTQRRVAAAADIPENRLSEIVCGWSEPREHERQALMRVLGCDERVFDQRAAAFEATAEDVPL